MSNQKSTYPQKTGKNSSLHREQQTPQKEYPSEVKLFLERKEENLQKFKNSNLSIDVKVKYEGSSQDIPIVVDDENNIIGNFCSYCYEYIEGANPWKSGSYVFTCCKNCLKSVIPIEDFLSNKGGSTLRTRRSMADPESVSVEWSKFEDLVNKGGAKLSLLAKKHRVYTSEMRDIISQKYGDGVVFKRGRYGGIFWNNEEKKG